jgi:hypothetical protein
MRKVILGMTMIAGFAFMSCEKDQNESTDNLGEEILESEETIRLQESGFTIVEAEELGGEVDHAYTEGVLEYEKDGELLASFDFAGNADEDYGKLEQDGEKKDCELKKHGKKHPFKKVVVEPVVKTEDCEHPVSGIIKFFDIKTDEWVATIDFGDGTCDDLVTKTTPEGSGEYHLYEIKPKGPKGQKGGE